MQTNTSPELSFKGFRVKRGGYVVQCIYTYRNGKPVHIASSDHTTIIGASMFMWDHARAAIESGCTVRYEPWS